MDSIKMVSTGGTMTIDFDERTVKYTRSGGLASTLNLTDVTFSFDEITGIELRQPTWAKLGTCFFIINGKRLLSPGLNIEAEFTQFSVKNKADFATLESALKRLSQVRSIEIRGEKGFNVEKAFYSASINPDVVKFFTNNTGSTLEVYKGGYVVLKHKGILNTWSKGGLKGEKRISFSSISAIDFRRATRMTNGYIQFSIIGGVERQSGVNGAVADENSIIFGNEMMNDDAQEIVNFIEDARMKAAQPQATTVINQASAADELKKFKELLDMGIITQEEFDKKKKDLLGL